jgi:hypothetical protein
MKLEKGIDVTAELRAVSQYDDRPQPAIPQTTVPAQSQSMPPQPIMPPMQQMHRSFLDVKWQPVRVEGLARGLTLVFHRFSLDGFPTK